MVVFSRMFSSHNFIKAENIREVFELSGSKWFHLFKQQLFLQVFSELPFETGLKINALNF